MSDAIATHRLSESGVTRMLEASVAKAREIGSPSGIGIVDAGGHLRAWRLMDGATALAFQSVLKKAKTAAFTGRPSGGLPPELATNLGLAIPDFANLAGGFPILKDGDVLGAIAAGGGEHDADKAVAQAGLDALDLS